MSLEVLLYKGQLGFIDTPSALELGAKLFCVAAAGGISSLSLRFFSLLRVWMPRKCRITENQI